MSLSHTSSGLNSLTPLPDDYSHGLIAVATMGMLSLISTASLFIFLTYKLLASSPTPIAQPSPPTLIKIRCDHKEHAPILNLPEGVCLRCRGAGDYTTTAYDVQCMPIDGCELNSGSNADDKTRASASLREAHPSPFPVLIYNLLLADMQESLGHALSTSWLFKNGIFTDSPNCFAQGFVKSNGNLAAGLLLGAFSICTYIVLVRQKPIPRRALYWSIAGIWIFTYFTTSLGIVITHNGRDVDGWYTRAGPWCWINSAYEGSRLYTHYLWIIASEVLTIMIHGIIWWKLRLRRKEGQRARDWKGKTGSNDQQISNYHDGSSKGRGRMTRRIVDGRSGPSVRLTARCSPAASTCSTTPALGLSSLASPSIVLSAKAQQTSSPRNTAKDSVTLASPHQLPQRSSPTRPISIPNFSFPLSTQHSPCRYSQSTPPGFHPLFLVYPIVFLVFTTPICLVRILSMLNIVTPSTTVLCWTASMVASNGLCNALLWTGTILFGCKTSVRSSGLERFAFRSGGGGGWGNSITIESAGGTQKKAGRWRGRGCVLTGAQLHLLGSAKEARRREHFKREQHKGSSPLKLHTFSGGQRWPRTVFPALRPQSPGKEEWLQDSSHCEDNNASGHGNGSGAKNRGNRQQVHRCSDHITTHDTTCENRDYPSASKGDGAKDNSSNTARKPAGTSCPVVRSISDAASSCSARLRGTGSSTSNSSGSGVARSEHGGSSGTMSLDDAGITMEFVTSVTVESRDTVRGL